MMKIGKVPLLLVLTVLLLNLSASSAWFGNKHKSVRNSGFPGETTSSRSLLLDRARSAIVFQVHGNVFPVGFYNVTLNIGQPPRPYFLDLDTGSDLTWLQCDAPCSHCSETPHPLYQPSNDLVPCEDPLCASLHSSNRNGYNCDYPDQCHYEIEYADQYSTLGVLVKDVYNLNFTNGKQLKVRMGLGCGYDQVFPAYSYHAVDGVLGLGRGRSSLISQLSNQGLLRNVVGHCLGTHGGGYMFFGDISETSRVTWTHMSSIDSKHYSAGGGELLFGGKATGVGNLLAIFDTGSSYTYFNFHAYQALISWLKKDLHGKPLLEAPDDHTLPICWHGRRPFRSINEVRKYFKPLALSFTTGRRSRAVFEIPPEAYLIISNLGNVCLGILNGSELHMGDVNLIGDISMLDKLMVYDNDKQMIGWSPANCDRVPKSRHASI
ncbi:hypothetical protein K1719_014702 [Acacia pycnantha]|nr:hypothetical protein K1719_014702 [Acacia pycnantha]